MFNHVVSILGVDSSLGATPDNQHLSCLTFRKKPSHKRISTVKYERLVIGSQVNTAPNMLYREHVPRVRHDTTDK